VSKHKFEDDPLEAAKKAADHLHSDTSISLDETFLCLRDLRDHVEMLIDAVENSMFIGNQCEEKNNV